MKSNRRRRVGEHNDGSTFALSGRARLTLTQRLWSQRQVRTSLKTPAACGLAAVSDCHLDVRFVTSCGFSDRNQTESQKLICANRPDVQSVRQAGADRDDFTSFLFGVFPIRSTFFTFHISKTQGYQRATKSPSSQRDTVK